MHVLLQSIQLDTVQIVRRHFEEGVGHIHEFHEALRVQQLHWLLLAAPLVQLGHLGRTLGHEICGEGEEAVSRLAIHLPLHLGVFAAVVEKAVAATAARALGDAGLAV